MKFFGLYHESLGKTLFTRLQYIIQIQDWEALSDVFWLKQGLDLLLAILVEDKPIILPANSAMIRPVSTSDAVPDGSGPQPMVTDIPEGSDEAPLTLDSLVLKHAQFLNEMSKLKVVISILVCSLITPIKGTSGLNMRALHLIVLTMLCHRVTYHFS